MKTLIKSIKKLESELLKIDVIQEQRQVVNEQVLSHVNNFLNDLPHEKTYEATFDANRTITATAISETPVDISKLLETIKEHIQKPGVNTASGNYFGYIPSGGLYTAALGDFISATINRYSSLFFMAPGAVQLEKSLIEWVMQLIGYPTTAFGNITSGASVATLIAITTARSMIKNSHVDYKKMVVYIGEHTHYCFSKALHIAGLSEVVQRLIPLDKNYRLDLVRLQQIIESDIKTGLMPWILVATAGTTNTGAVDPLVTVYEISQKYGLWLHIDAAYGGFFALTKRGKQLLEGLSHADSIVLDAHKSLFMPYGIAFILIKNHKSLLQAHYYTANFLQDLVPETEVYSAANLSLELTRPFRGLSLWLSLQLLGVQYFQIALDEKILLAHYFYEKILSISNFEALEPNLSIVLFRYISPNIAPNLFNPALHQEILQDGTIFLSSTTINDNYYLRFACLSFRSHLQNVNLAIEIINQTVDKLIHPQLTKVYGPIVE